MVEEKVLVFRENTYEFLKVHSVGYCNFKNNRTMNFWRANVWHALYYVHSGTGSLNIRGKKYELKPGSFYLIIPNEPIKYVYDEVNPMSYSWITFYPTFAEEIANVLGFTSDTPVRTAKSPQKMDRIFNDLLSKETTTPDTYFHTLSLLMKILASEVSNVEAPRFTIQHETQVMNAKQLIELNYANVNFNIHVLSEILYINHSQLSRIFKNVTGITPVSYLIDVRLKHAGELLCKKKYTIKELCEAVGFGDEWHFMRSFKKKYGVTVSEYRKKHIK